MIVCLGALTLPMGRESRSSAGGGGTPGKFELKKTAKGQFFFNPKAANSQTILTGEQYKTKASAENGIASVKGNAPDAKPEDLTQTAANP
jgi:uncharacterized protein